MKIVVKLGSAVLMREADGSIDRQAVLAVAQQVDALMRQGHVVVVVSSGAVASCPNAAYSKSLRAAIGQPALMQLYGNYFGIFGRTMCQLLYTHEDMDGRRSVYTKAVLQEAIARGVVPIINANDSVSSEELDALRKYADNDALAARVAMMINADRVYLLIGERGLVDYATGDIVTVVEDMRRAARLARGKSAVGRGGMASKLAIADLLCKKGMDVWLLPGKQRDAIIASMDGVTIGTRCIAKKRRTARRAS